MLQLKVELQGVRPRVWRRILIPADIRLPRLRLCLLHVMGWRDEYSHKFEFAEGKYGAPDGDWPDKELKDESAVTLIKALGPTGMFTWTYDFADDWIHQITVERADYVPAKRKLQCLICLNGMGACPPQNVGGRAGYEGFLQAIANASHPQHEQMKARVGRAFNPKAFDVSKAQERLHRIAVQRSTGAP